MGGEQGLIMLSAYDLSNAYAKGVPWLAPSQLPIIVEGGGSNPAARALALPSNDAWTDAWAGAPLLLEFHHAIGLGIPYEDSEPSLLASRAPLDDVARGLERSGVLDIAALSALHTALDDANTTIVVTRRANEDHWDGFMAFRRDLLITRNEIAYVIDPAAIVAGARRASLASLLAGYRRQVTCDMETMAAAALRLPRRPCISLKILGDDTDRDNALIARLASLADLARGSIFGQDDEYAPTGASPFDGTTMFSPPIVSFDAHDRETILHAD